jgi:hypothetical protein
MQAPAAGAHPDSPLDFPEWLQFRSLLAPTSALLAANLSGEHWFCTSISELMYPFQCWHETAGLRLCKELSRGRCPELGALTKQVNALPNRFAAELRPWGSDKGCDVPPILASREVFRSSWLARLRAPSWHPVLRAFAKQLKAPYSSPAQDRCEAVHSETPLCRCGRHRLYPVAVGMRGARFSRVGPSSAPFSPGCITSWASKHSRTGSPLRSRWQARNHFPQTADETAGLGHFRAAHCGRRPIRCRWRGPGGAPLDAGEDRRRVTEAEYQGTAD